MVSIASPTSPLTPAQALGMLIQRNYIVYRDAWKLFLTGFLEPVFYLLSIGIGVGQLIDTFEFNGQAIPYAEFVAPGMLAASAFNGALLDSTYNVFFKLKFDKLYDQMLATPLSTTDIARGEIAWGQLRGGAYSAAFLLVMAAMGLISSWWALLALPAALLIGFAFSAVCMALTTYMKSLAGLRQDHAGAAAAVPLLGHVLPGHHVRRLAAVGRRVHPALPRRRALPRADHRRALLGVRDLGGLPAGDGADRPGWSSVSDSTRFC